MFCLAASCPKPDPPAHGRRLGRVFGIGHEVHFLCKSGYELIGPRTRVCLESLKWSGQQPMCRRESPEVNHRSASKFCASVFLNLVFLFRPQQHRQLPPLLLSRFSLLLRLLFVIISCFCCSVSILFSNFTFSPVTHVILSLLFSTTLSLHTLPGLHPLHL